jgi:hypothetical protein
MRIIIDVPDLGNPETTVINRLASNTNIQISPLI